MACAAPDTGVRADAMVRYVMVRQKKAAQLARWLGPWADPTRVPQGVVRRTERLDLPRSVRGGTLDGPVRTYRYEPRNGRVTGAYLVVPGLHYAGPDDPRLDRFCRVIASAGFIVVALFLDDYLRLEVTSRAAEETAVACDHVARLCADRGLPRPALFSVSFGSTPTIAVAGSERHRDQIGGVVLFGAFRDFRATIRFAITRRAFDGLRSVDLPHDPLNTPAVFINLLPHLDVGGDRARLAQAWLEMARRTWGRPELRPTPKRAPIAEVIAADLPPSLRDLFLVGCGLRPGGGAYLEAGLAAANGHFDFTDPAGSLARITAPVVIAHGRDDDVVPYTEAPKILAGLSGDHPHQLHLTGLWGHTGQAGLDPAAAKHELETLTQLLFALVDAPHEQLVGA